MEGVELQIASTVGLTAVALVGVAILLLKDVWGGVTRCRNKNWLVHPLFPMIAWVFLFMAIVVPIGVFIESENPGSIATWLVLYLFMVCAVAIIAGLVYIINIIKRKKAEINDDVFYIASFMYLLSSISTVLASLVAITFRLLDFSVFSQYFQASYSWGRWLLFSGIIFFVFGVLFLGLAKLQDKPRGGIKKRRAWRGSTRR